MRLSLAARLSLALVACYPPRWKERYREEMLDVLDQHRASHRTVLSLAGGAVTAHIDPSYRMEKPVVRIRNDVVRRILIGIGALAAVPVILAGILGRTAVSRWQPPGAAG